MNAGIALHGPRYAGVHVGRRAERTQDTLVFPRIWKKRDPFRPHFGTLFTIFGTFRDVESAFVDALNRVRI